MADDTELRRDLVRRIESRRADVQLFLRVHRPRTRRRATITVVLTSLAAVFTAGPAFGGEGFAETVGDLLDVSADSTVWRALCLLALLVSVSAAVLANLGKSQDDVARLSNAEAANAELEGLSSLLQFGHLPADDAVKLYQQYTAKIPFVDDRPDPVPAGAGPAPPAGSGYPAPPPGYHPAPRPAPGPYPPPPPHR
jgi:hypothetical protein